MRRSKAGARGCSRCLNFECTCGTGSVPPALDRRMPQDAMDLPRKRCPWSGNDPLYVDYHDKEWGVPVHDDRTLFEFLILEGMQAGLSWITILRKRENFRRAFAGFDPEKVARFGKREIARLTADAGIVRNELKVLAAVANAQAVLRVRDELGSFDKYLAIRRRRAQGEPPAQHE